ncbi:MAG: hypothetical protein ABIZ05_00650, partial [Pseudonocardiaceae bacterium]
HARSGAPDLLVAVISAVGRCHEAVARSAAARGLVRPLLMSDPLALLDELCAAAADDVELRVALAFATARDAKANLPLRGLLSPVTVGPPLGWTHRPTLAPLGGGLGVALAEAARRRGFPGAVGEVERELEPAVKGVRIGYQRGVQVVAADVTRFIAGELNNGRLADLLAGLLTIDWRDAPDAILRGAPRQPDPALDLLLPFTGTGPIRLPDKALLRPGTEWPALLMAGRTTEVLADAARRLRIAGLRHVITPGVTPHDGARLAAVLLLRVPDGDRLTALHRVAVVPQPTSEQNQETPA